MNETAIPRADTVATDRGSLPDVHKFIGGDGPADGQTLAAVPAQRARASQAVRAPAVPPVEWHGNRQTCIVNIYVKARLAWLRNPGEPMHLGLLVTTSGDIHNPQVVQSINVPFSVDVLVDGVQAQNIPHDLFAPAVLDPRGSDQWYVWKDEADDVDSADLADLDRLTLEINI